MPKITLSAPRQGIAQSAHIGYADVRNMDIDTVEGVVRLNNILEKESASVIEAQIKWFARDPETPAEVRALDSDGIYYESSDSGDTWSKIDDGAGAGHGMIIKWGYAFVCKDTKIDVFKISDDSETADWVTIDADADWHPMIDSKNDGKLYGGAGQYIFSIEENSGQTFDPGNAATYTFTQQALDLPDGYRVKCLEELGNNLMIGTWKGSAVTDIREADIFPWDRSAVSFGQPVKLEEFGVHAMKNDGNSLIVLAGVDGVVYSCNGASAWAIGQLPQNLSGGKYLEFYPDSLVKYKNKMFLGVGQGGSTSIAGMGVYSLKQTGRGNILNLEHIISTLRDGSTGVLKPSALLPMTRDSLLVGWRDPSGYGIDLTTVASYAYSVDYSGYFDSPLYEVGYDLNQWKPKGIELHLGKPLATGEGIKISYRKSLSDSWVAIKTMAFADNGVGAMISKTVSTDVELNVKKGEQIQLRVALLGTATTTPEFKFLILQ